MGKTNKVTPTSSPKKDSDTGEKRLKRDKEESEEDKESKLKHAANEWGSDSHKRKLMQPFQIAGGMLPPSIGGCFPKCMTRSFPIIFGSDNSKNLKGGTAAALRLLEISGFQVRYIKKFFDKIDEENEGKISLPDFFYFLDVKDTKFMRGLLKRANFNREFQKPGLLTFNDEDQMLIEIFKMFDADGSGYIDKDELEALVEKVNGLAGGTWDGSIKEFLQSIEIGDEILDFDAFIKINKKSPLTFYPVVQFQNSLREKTLGASSWKTIVQNFDSKESARIKLNNRTATPMSDQLGILVAWSEQQQRNAERKKGPVKKSP